MPGFIEESKNSFRSLAEKAILRLVYLTPFGYFLDLLDLESGRRTLGIYVELGQYSPVSASVRENPTAEERINWSVNGVVLLAQAIFILSKQNAEPDIAQVYAMTALIWGLVCMASAIFPKIRWNKKLF